ncbi:Density-regulated protein [Aphelenchoides bicaudatus]|nr:Density-regulated protein [Aphelenchoides bicaudatus]
MAADTEALSTDVDKKLEINDDGTTAPTTDTVKSEVSYPLNVQYCGECTMPLEYCSFSGRFDQCKAWREKNIDQLTAANVQVDDDEATDEKKHRKRGGKGQPKAAKEVKAVPVTLQCAPRGKNKSVTIVKGLSTHGIDLKQAAKFFAKKFACSSSVVAADEIVIQGDVKDKLFDIIPETWSQVDEDALVDLGEQKH